ncbi:helix-turn-helix domain-containing protein [Haliscomenobacter sp.]|uniref:helix-turn-helix domain-containing protein n=1 Tax=Haliscomenobacter sp. TaxID=2717303 RepID=UPI003592F235
MISPKTVSENIRYWREQRNYTQAYVADQAGISRRWYISLENGMVIPQISHILAIAEVLNIEPDLLFKKEQKSDKLLKEGDIEEQVKQVIRKALEKLL